MLEAKHLTYSVGDKKLLSDVSVPFEPGLFHLIIGPNGAGKSTLIKALCGSITSQTGSIQYNGKNIQDLSVAQLAKQRAVLSQNIELAFPLKVEEVVMMGRYPHFEGNPSEYDREVVQQAIRFFDVNDLLGRNYLTLSGGEKQRVQFARVAAQVWDNAPDHCRYLLLDEPLTFLDVHYQFDFMHKMQELIRSQNLVVVGVVHDLNLTAKFADRVVLMHQGKILSQGDRETVLTADHIRTAYRLEPFIHRDNKGGLFLFFE